MVTEARETSKSMHLVSQMNRFTHETKNIKSMIANFKTEMENKDVMKRSKSEIGLQRAQPSREEEPEVESAQRGVPKGTERRMKSSSQLRHSIYLDKEHMHKKSANLNQRFGAQSRAEKEKDETESMRETLNLNFAGMEKIKKKLESAKMDLAKGDRPKRHRSFIGEAKSPADKLNFKWEFSRKRGNDNNIRVETNMLKKNKSATRLGGKKTPLQKFLEEQTRNMPKWNGTRFVDASNRDVLKLDRTNHARKKKSSVKQRIARIDAELSNYKKFKKDIENEHSRQKEMEEPWADDSKASIKYMVVNNYMHDDESESDNENKRILEDLDNPDAFKKKPQKEPLAEEPEVFEKPSPVEEAPSDPASDSKKNYEFPNAPANDYLNIFRDFEIYSIERQNLLSLKACSLFDKNKLVENDFLDVWCDTKKTVSRSTWEVSLLLTFAPKKPNFVISTRLFTYEAIEAFPSFINEFSFDNPVGQSFNIKMIGVFKPIDFPKAQINLHSAEDPTQVTRFELPLPFSINKFVTHRKISDTDLIEYVQNSMELASQQFVLDKDYLVRASDLLEILPELVVFDENLFCMFLDFGSDMNAAVKLEVLRQLEVRVTLYSHQNAPLFHDYLSWFLWMFKK